MNSEAREGDDGGVEDERDGTEASGEGVGGAVLTRQRACMTQLIGGWGCPCSVHYHEGLSVSHSARIGGQARVVSTRQVHHRVGSVRLGECPCIPSFDAAVCGSRHGGPRQFRMRTSSAAL
jgi:hypothetical protein